jgi:uncharacterized protein YbjQ (UPF0145 family)
MAIICAGCGEKQGMMAALTTDLLTPGNYYCPKCLDANRQKEERIRLIAKKILVTTTPKVDGYYVAKYIGIESVEFVIGTGIFSEVTSDIADIFGRRSSAFEKKLQIAKQTAMNALKYIAAEQGANAVIGIDLDYTEFSGNRVALIINGTLVRLAPLQSATSGKSLPDRSE